MGAKVPSNFRSMERNYPGTFAPKMGKTTTYTHLHADDLTVKTLLPFCGRRNCLSIHTTPSPDPYPGGEGVYPSQRLDTLAPSAL